MNKKSLTETDIRTKFITPAPPPRTAANLRAALVTELTWKEAGTP